MQIRSLSPIIFQYYVIAMYNYNDNNNDFHYYDKCNTALNQSPRKLCSLPWTLSIISPYQLSMNISVRLCIGLSMCLVHILCGSSAGGMCHFSWRVNVMDNGLLEIDFVCFNPIRWRPEFRYIVSLQFFMCAFIDPLRISVHCPYPCPTHSYFKHLKFYACKMLCMLNIIENIFTVGWHSIGSSCINNNNSCL